MRNMSFAMTLEQFDGRTKTVTRRNGWLHAKVGDVIMGIEKGMGLKPGQKVRRLHRIRVLSVRRERIDAVTLADVWREGFPDLTRLQFVDLYCKANHKKPHELCTRIEFEHLDQDAACSLLSSSVGGSYYQNGHRFSVRATEEIVAAVTPVLQALSDCAGEVGGFDSRRFCIRLLNAWPEVFATIGPDDLNPKDETPCKSKPT